MNLYDERLQCVLECFEEVAVHGYWPRQRRRERRENERGKCADRYPTDPDIWMITESVNLQCVLECFEEVAVHGYWPRQRRRERAVKLLRDLYLAYDEVELEHTSQLMHVHPPTDCAGRVCSVHNRSDHRMRHWPQMWRADRQMMERLCPLHGCGHPDPDDIAYKEATMSAKEFKAGAYHIFGCGCLGSEDCTTKEGVTRVIAERIKRLEGRE